MRCDIMDDPVKLEKLARIEGEMRATPQDPFWGAVSRGLGAVHGFVAKPFGYDNPPAALISEALGIPALQRTTERISYGAPLTSGAGGLGGTTRPLPDTVDAALAVLPAVGPALKGAERGATALGRAGERLAERVVPPVMERGGLPAVALGSFGTGTTSNVIKPKGGNWLAGSVEEAIQPLKAPNSPILSGEVINEAAGRDLFSEYRKHYEKDPTVGLHDWMRTKHPDVYARIEEPEDAAINRWLNKKLAPYIRNEMGTPEDPLRLLADRGVTHIPEGARGLEQVTEWIPETLEGRRAAAGFPRGGMSQTTMGQGWEQLADEAIHNMPARMRTSPDTGGGSHSALVTEQNNPWLRTVPPETMTYGVYPVEVRSELGFDHLVDELKGALSAGNELPKNLQLTPQQLEKVTVPQAVELVSKINKWRSDQAAKAEKLGMLENLKATPRLESPEVQLSFVDKPGMKWVDIPETTAEQGMNFCKTVGKQGGWCTANDWAAKSYGAGDNRLAVMLDADGRPHVQAKITTAKNTAEGTEMADYLAEEEAIGDQFYRNIATVLERRGYENANELMEMVSFGNTRNLPEDVRRILPEVELEAENMLPKVKQPLPDITELKPVENTFTGKRAEEYTKRDPQYKEKVTQSVLDFLNKGEWGRVDDLHHYDIVDLHSPDSLVDGLKVWFGEGKKLPQEVVDKFNAALDANPEAPRFMSERQLRDFVEPPPGYKDGGSVRPSEAQIDAGNYAKEHRSLHGLRISIENPKGSVRSGVDKAGKAWSQKMRHDYGYIRGTKGADKDHVDVFLGEHAHDDRHPVVVIDQVDPRTRKFDEHKVMMGFKTVKDAVDAYHANYEKGWKGFHKATPMSMAAFKGWALGGEVKKPAHKVKVEDPVMLEKLHAMGLN